MSNGVGRIIANDHETATGLFTRNPDFAVPVSPLKRGLAAAVPPDRAEFCDATELATKLVGDAVGANLFLVGFAWQRGVLPVSLEAINRAIELNGVSVAMNRSAFTWGRKAAVNLTAVQAAAEGERPDHHRLSASLNESITRRIAFLTDYQDAAYGRRYVEVVEQVRAAERSVTEVSEPLTAAVAQSLFRLMAYKDEYEVARLYTDTGFKAQVEAQFEGPYTLAFHLAPPLLARRNPASGLPRKARFGPWVYGAFQLLAKARRLRGTPLDPFGYTAERRMERRLADDYARLVLTELLPALTPASHPAAVEVAEAAQAIKGFGHVKRGNVERAEARQARALERFRAVPQRDGTPFAVSARTKLAQA